MVQEGICHVPPPAGGKISRLGREFANGPNVCNAGSDHESFQKERISAFGIATADEMGQVAPIAPRRRMVSFVLRVPDIVVYCRGY